MRVIYVKHSRHNDTPCIGYITVDIAQGGFFFSSSLFVFLLGGGGWGLGATVMTSGDDDNSGSCESLGAHEAHEALRLCGSVATSGYDRDDRYGGMR